MCIDSSRLVLDSSMRESRIASTIEQRLQYLVVGEDQNKIRGEETFANVAWPKGSFLSGNE